MAKRKTITTSIWGNPFFQSLEPLEKLLWFHLMTVGDQETSGIFQLTIRTIHDDLRGDNTAVPESEIKAMMQKFVKLGRIIYEDNYVGMVDQHQHNAYLNSPYYRQGIIKQINQLPPHITEKFVPIIFPKKWLSEFMGDSLAQPMDSLGETVNRLDKPIIYTKHNLTQPNLTQPKTNTTKLKLGKPPEPEPGYDADAHRADLQSIASATLPVFDAAVNDNVIGGELTDERKAEIAAEVKAKFAAGKWKETDDTDYINTITTAQQKQIEARRKARLTPKAECDAWDKSEPGWFLKYITLTEKQMANDAAKYGAAKVGMFLRILARRIRMGRLDVDSPISYYRTAIRDNWSLEEAAGWKEGAE